MIRHIRRSAHWFGVVAALLLIALPVQADDIEPEPYVEEEPEPEPEPEPESFSEPEASNLHSSLMRSGWTGLDEGGSATWTARPLSERLVR